MAQEVHEKQMIGDPAHLAFEVAWPTEQPADVRGLGWGQIVLWCGGARIWTTGKARRPVEWTWIDLVDHLARSWSFLLYEDVAPFGLVASGLEDLRDPALLNSVRGKSAIEVEDAVHAFQHRHDLAAGLKGIHLPSVWLLREGHAMWLRSADKDYWRPISEVTDLFEKFVAEVRAHVVIPASRARLAFDRWDNRKKSIPHDLFIRLRTGLTPTEFKSLTPKKYSNNPAAWWGPPEQDTPLMAAARLSQPLDATTRRALIHAISEVPVVKTPGLDELQAAALPVLEAVSEQRPYEQGYALALWLRTKLSLVDAVDPEALLSSWKVHLATLPELEESLDAVACWGTTGPAVLINPTGRHASSEGGRRATLAHEIAHLVLDRGRQLLLAEVFGGATPVHLEQRAKAFAAELLLPREVAGSAVAKYPSLAEAASYLQEAFGVSREVVGWQIKNGSGWDLLDERERREVKRWAQPNRGRYRQPSSRHTAAK